MAIGLIVALAACFGAAALGSIFTTPRLGDWYANIRKPAWTPPSWLFAPVWTLLFIMMAVSVWLVWLRAGFAGASWAFALFAVQLALNVLWSALFFGMRNPAAAFAEVIVFWLAIAATALAFSRIDALSALLLVPYLLWVAFAAILNFAIWRLNAS
ncbi:MAG TPA: TspO/MBR family protein [Candidatus Eremiobacteraceae bacterium]|nr:TspO/MBR family protein [Candidatus Eremiobacteraceae bacterium]